MPSKRSQSERLVGVNSRAAHAWANRDGGTELIAVIEEAVELEMVQ